jgi:hypothetical protein
MSQTVIDWSQDYATWIAGDGAALGSFTIAAGTTSPRPWTFANLLNSYIAADYDLTHRGTACSVKGRASNSTGVIADISAATLGHVLRRDATPVIGFGTLLAGAFATAPGIVTPAMLDNGTARTVLGRSANSAGARADIAGAGAVTGQHFLTDNGTTLAFRSYADANTIYEVDFSSLANNTLTDGTESIDGINWTVANAAEAGTFDILNGTGLRIIAATSNGGASTMNSTTQAAAYLYTTLGSIPGYDPAYSYIAEIYCSTLVHEASGEGAQLFLWDVANSPNTSSAAKWRSAEIINSAGTRILRTTITTTSVSGTENRAGHNVIQIRLNGLGTGPVNTGTWAGSWPVCTTGLVWQTATAAGLDSYSHNNMRIGIALLSANDASPTTAVTVQRMRIRRAG